MKSTIKLALVVMLFSSVAFADGDMGSGGRTCPNNQTTCLVSSEEPQKEETTTETDSILTTVQEYLDSMYKYFEI
jgi:hypothetical protein